MLAKVFVEFNVILLFDLFADRNIEITAAALPALLLFLGLFTDELLRLLYHLLKFLFVWIITSFLHDLLILLIIFINGAQLFLIHFHILS